MLNSAIYEAFHSELHNLPIYLLQAVAIVGIMATLLLYRGRTALSDEKSSTLGITLGLTSFLLTALMEDWIQLPSKPYIRNDILFLAGFFGGLRNAGWAAILTWAGRILFGGGGVIVWSSIDIATVAIGGVVIRHLFFQKHGLEIISHKQIAQLLLWRYVVVSLPILIYYLANLVPQELLLSVAFRRTLTSFTVSVFIVYTLVFLLRSEILRERVFFHDAMSNLPNRRALQKNIESQLNHTENSHQVLALLVIRNLHSLVLEHNHDWADGYYRRLGEKLHTLKEMEFFEHYKPEIFFFSDRAIALVLHETSTAHLQEIHFAQNLLSRLQQTPTMKVTLPPRLSLGLLDIKKDSHAVTASQFLRAMTLMENHSQESVHYFESSPAKQLQLDKYTRRQIEHWIKSENAPVWLQPKVRLLDSLCIGAESLLRAEKPDQEHNFILPSYILSIAEQHHLLLRLEIAIIQTAIRHMQKLPGLKISVNLSPRLLEQQDFGRDILRMLIKNSVEPNSLIIEIIETNKLHITETVLRNVTELTEAGVNFSLDDFGTGYSSLSLMARLPFNELKLDYSMISNMEEPRTQTAILSAIDSARRYAIDIVAEGIETTRQKEKLIEMGISYDQGYLFAKAMPLNRFTEYSLKPIPIRSS